MSIEDDLRDSLQRRADSVHPQPDLDDVSERTASRDRRTRRFLTAGLVVALIAGPLAGFAIGSAGDDGGGDVATGGATSGQEIARSGGDAAAMSAAPFGGAGPLAKLFVRTSPDGVEIRAYRSTPTVVALTQPVLCPAGASCPEVAPECTVPTPESMVLGELSTDTAVTVATSVGSQVSGIDVSAAGWGTFGIEEGGPARWVIASVGDGVENARATFPGGATDEMEPIDGVVVLASRVDDPMAEGAALELLGADGSVVQRVDLTPGGGGMATATSSGSGSGSSGSAESHVTLRSGSSSSASRSSTDANASSSVSSSDSTGPGVASSCIATPTPLPNPVLVPAPDQPLPAPGEQPADAAAARTAIEKAFSVAYDGGISDSAAKIAAVEDGEAVLPVLEAGSNGAFAEQVKSASAKVLEVVFTSPTEAAVRYDIVTSTSRFNGLIGGAVSVNGSWKVARSTMCKDISLAGVSCPPAK